MGLFPALFGGAGKLETIAWVLKEQPCRGRVPAPKRCHPWGCCPIKVPTPSGSAMSLPVLSGSSRCIRRPPNYPLWSLKAVPKGRGQLAGHAAAGLRDSSQQLSPATSGMGRVVSPLPGADPPGGFDGTRGTRGWLGGGRGRGRTGDRWLRTKQAAGEMPEGRLRKGTGQREPYSRYIHPRRIHP